MTFKLLLIAFFIANYTQAQVNKPLPTKRQWETYFFEKKAAIQTKLYNLALQGKIKAYWNDSLAGYYSIETLKMRGGKEELVKTFEREDGLIIDSIAFKPLNPKDISSFWFEKTIDYNQNLQKETNELKGVAMTFKFTIGGISKWEMPLFWISITDLKLNLNKNEYEWLMLIYFYSKNDNYIGYREFEDNQFTDIFWEMNHANNLKSVHTSDTLLYRKIASSLNGCNFYIGDFFYYSDKQKNLLPLIYDHQSNKNITPIEFKVKYQKTEKLVHQINEKNLIEDVDTTIIIPQTIEWISSIEIDDKTSKIKNLIYEFKPNEAENTVYKFSIDAALLNRYNPIPNVFWFFEDYYRYKP